MFYSRAMNKDLLLVVSRAQVAFRASAAGGLSVARALLCKFDYPIYALIAAVIVTDLSPSQTRQLGMRRIVSTVAGAACGATLRQILPLKAWAISLGVVLAMLICHLAEAHDGARVAGYICGIVMLAHGDHPWSYAFFRLLETVLGIVVAWLISFVPMLIRIEKAESETDRADAIAATRFR